MNVKDAARERLNDLRHDVLVLSHAIHARPELGFEEEHAVARLSDALADAGFTVEPRAGGLATAFVARAGHGPLEVAICAEYDALPGIGHACGHNMIAAMALGAGGAMGRGARELVLSARVAGTPPQ